MLSLILSLMTIILNWYPIQAYASFSLVFHKGRENSCFIFQSVLFIIGIYFYSHSLWWKMIEKWYWFGIIRSWWKLFSIDICFIFNIGIKNVKLILFSIWYPYCKMCLVFNKKRLVYVFQIGIKSVKYFQLVFTIGIKISYMFISFYWYQNFVGFFKIFCLFSIGIIMFRCILSY